jgi:hypothetical protein
VASPAVEAVVATFCCWVSVSSGSWLMRKSEDDEIKGYF